MNDQIKYHAARFVWRRRHQYTPIKKIKWVTWWEKRFNDKFDEYVASRRKTNANTN